MRTTAGWWLLIGGALIALGAVLQTDNTPSATFDEALSSGVVNGLRAMVTVAVAVVVAVVGGLVIRGYAMPLAVRVVLFVGLAVVALLYVLLALWLVPIGAIVAFVGALYLPSSTAHEDQSREENP